MAATATGWVVSENQIGYPGIDANVDIDGRNQSVKTGQIVRATHATYGSGEFIFLKGVASTAVGSWVVYRLDDGTTALASANDVGPVAVAMSANTTAANGGWYQISGKAVGKVLASFADNGQPYLTSTAGSVDDAVVSGDFIYNALGASAIDTPSTGLAEFELSRPFVTDGG